MSRSNDMKYFYFREGCDSFAVQMTKWFYPNFDGRESGSDAPTEDIWCDRCSEGVSLVELRRDEEGFWHNWAMRKQDEQVFPTLRKMNLKQLEDDIKSIYSDESRDLRESLAKPLDGIASLFGEHGLHRQENIPVADRYLRNAALFERLAEAIRGRRQ